VGEERSGSRRGRTESPDIGRPHASTSKRRREGRRRLRGGASGADRRLRGRLKKRGAPHRTASEHATVEGHVPHIRGPPAVHSRVNPEGGTLAVPAENTPKECPRHVRVSVRAGQPRDVSRSKQRTYRAVHPRVVVWHIEETYCCGASNSRTATLSRYTRCHVAAFLPFPELRPLSPGSTRTLPSGVGNGLLARLDPIHPR
jgi:hypothetical protein